MLPRREQCREFFYLVSTKSPPIGHCGNSRHSYVSIKSRARGFIEADKFEGEGFIINALIWSSKASWGVDFRCHWSLHRLSENLQSVEAISGATEVCDSQSSESLFTAFWITLPSSSLSLWSTMDDGEPPQKKHISWRLATRISLLPLTRKSRSPKRLRLPFGSMCKESSISIDLTTCSPSQLDEALCRFYLGVRNKNGEFYKKKVYLSPIKHALKAFFIGDKIRLKGAFNGQ